MDKKAHPTILANIMDWDYQSEPPGKYDAIWASPPCTHYSIARTTGGPRDFAGADAIVLRTLEIIDWFAPKFWFMENPQTGLLKSRAFMQLHDFRDVCYCRYGYKYRKATRIWGNLDWTPRPMCTRKDPCENVVDGRHLECAQRLSLIHI